jgi:hypothetical protein
MYKYVRDKSYFIIFRLVGDESDSSNRKRGRTQPVEPGRKTRNPRTTVGKRKTRVNIITNSIIYFVDNDMEQFFDKKYFISLFQPNES